MAAPEQVWTLAADRTTEVMLGIVCVGLVHALVLPRFAGDVLRRSLRSTFASMAHYAAVILRPGTPDRVYTILRRQMAGEVIKFAGSTAGYKDDPIGANAQFSCPKGIAVDREGNVYVADPGVGVIRKISPAGAVSTLAGSTSERLAVKRLSNPNR